MILLCVLAVGTAFLITYLLSFLFVRPLKSWKLSDLNGRHCLITGGSKGIGRALAIELVKTGCNVTIVARDVVQLQVRRRTDILLELLYCYFGVCHFVLFFRKLLKN